MTHYADVTVTAAMAFEYRVVIDSTLRSARATSRHEDGEPVLMNDVECLLPSAWLVRAMDCCLAALLSGRSLSNIERQRVLVGENDTPGWASPRHTLHLPRNRSVLRRYVGYGQPYGMYCRVDSCRRRGDYTVEIRYDIVGLRVITSPVLRQQQCQLPRRHVNVTTVTCRQYVTPSSGKEIIGITAGGASCQCHTVRLVNGLVNLLVNDYVDITIRDRMSRALPAQEQGHDVGDRLRRCWYQMHWLRYQVRDDAATTSVGDEYIVTHGRSNADVTVDAAILR